MTMIDWDAMMGDAPAPNVPVCPGQTGPCPDGLGQPEPARAAALGGIVPVVPIVPVKNQGARENKARAGGGVAENLCASEYRSSDDDRIVCTECGNLNDNSVCQIARPGVGALVVAMRGYRPPLDLLQRCPGFVPLQDANDQRNGLQRLPGLLTSSTTKGGNTDA